MQRSLCLVARALLALVPGLLAPGCGDNKPDAQPDANTVHDTICAMVEASVGQHGGFAAPGVAGAPRWGMPAAPPSTRRVRRNWLTLNAAEKKHVIDAFIALKQVTVTSGQPGAPRADYASLCDEIGLQSYQRNLYDYYVEAHANAFVSMMTPHQTHTQMAHQSPQFLVWHRYLVLRAETDLAEAIGDPSFALPYWDWTDCYQSGAPGTCPQIFERDYLGSPGTCDRATSAVEGYLTEQGFRVNISTNADNPFTPQSIVCGQRPVVRGVGCATEVVGPASAADVRTMFARGPYDTAPYDACNTEEDVSFRQYLEGFSNDAVDLACIGAGCGMHGRAHLYVGGDMDRSSAAPNDPIFFLNHSNVDRLWAAWQEANLASGDPARSADHGNPAYPAAYRGPLFIWNQISAPELFDYKALGYEYDVLPAP
jgi:tyrosinase